MNERERERLINWLFTEVFQFLLQIKTIPVPVIPAAIFMDLCYASDNGRLLNSK